MHNLALLTELHLNASAEEVREGIEICCQQQSTAVIYRTSSVTQVNHLIGAGLSVPTAALKMLYPVS